MKGWRVDNKQRREWNAIGGRPAPEGAEWLETQRLSEQGPLDWFHRDVFDRIEWAKIRQPFKVELFKAPGRYFANDQMVVELVNLSTGERVMVDADRDPTVFVPCEAPKEFA